jgi:hypothetical protein
MLTKASTGKKRQWRNENEQWDIGVERKKENWMTVARRKQRWMKLGGVTEHGYNSKL